MKNEYFRLVQIYNNDKNDFEVLDCVRKYDDRNIWRDICKQFLNTKEYAEKSYEDPYGSIYHLDLKHFLNIIAPDILDDFKIYLVTHNISLEQDDIAIYLASNHDYARFDDKFANEMAFLEYINSEYSEMDKRRDITEEILLETGFEYLENESNSGKEANKLNPELCHPDYKIFRKWTNGTHPLKLDIDNGYNNRGTKWHLHIDNEFCSSIGSADIDNVWEFNTLMQVFKSKFKL